MDVGGSRNGASHFEEAQCGGPLGRAPLLGTLKGMLGLLFHGARGYQGCKSEGSGTLVRLQGSHELKLDTTGPSVKT
jgi:hypothetical protein